MRYKLSFPSTARFYEFSKSTQVNIFATAWVSRASQLKLLLQKWHE